MNWTPGPARCRSPEYEAEILATDMGGDFPILGRYRRKGDERWKEAAWMADGQSRYAANRDVDLMPQTITREALAEEVLDRACASRSPKALEQAIDLVAHVIDAVKNGRVE